MLWFLDWSVLSFVIVVLILIFVALGTRNMLAVFGLFVLLFFTTFCHTHYLDNRLFSLYPKEYYSTMGDKGSTLGELWCNYTEYNGELCKNYVAYALNNQKITALKKQNDEQEKQTKLEKEKAQKDKIRANYEKTLKEIGRTSNGGIK